MKTNWRENNNTLSRTFEFKDFKEALTFVNEVGVICEELNHHPNISMYDYKYVIITTTTHDVGNTLTELDYTLTQRIDELFEK
ncbi:MAG: 4a-hydroxytetrahydrobiopterin dehydratase [Candidatus Nanoarchaeia archaeon]